MALGEVTMNTLQEPPMRRYDRLSGHFLSVIADFHGIKLSKLFSPQRRNMNEAGGRPSHRKVYADLY